MESFKRKNQYGIEYEYFIVSELNENNRKFIVYTDLVKDQNGDLRLFAAEVVNNEIVDIEGEIAERIINEFKTEMDKMKKQVEDVKDEYNDLSFTSINEDGLEVINDILKIVPNNNSKDEPYIVFTDYRLDDNDEFINQYGKIVGKDNSYAIETNISREEIEYINNMLEDEIVKYVNDALEENMYE